MRLYEFRVTANPVFERKRFVRFGVARNMLLCAADDDEALRLAYRHAYTTFPAPLTGLRVRQLGAGERV